MNGDLFELFVRVFLRLTPSRAFALSFDWFIVLVYLCCDWVE